MKREAKILLSKGTDSLFLAVDHFNRPHDRGRKEAVLIFLDRAFELLLKSAIIHRGGKIRERRDKNTLSFDKCIRKAISDGSLKILNEEEALTIQTINGLRDAAQHYVVDLSENYLYLYAQSGLTLFSKILLRIFQAKLCSFFPERVLPIATEPPQNLAVMMNAEFKHIKDLVAPGSRKRVIADARLRGIAVLERSVAGVSTQPTQRDIDEIVSGIRSGKGWDKLFPGVATLQLDSSGSGFAISLRISKKEGEPVRLVAEGTPGASVVGVKRVNELDYYSLNGRQLASKLSMSEPKMRALAYYVGVRDDEEYFKVIKVDSQTFKRYSPKSIAKLQEAKRKLDMDRVWKATKRGTMRPSRPAEAH